MATLLALHYAATQRIRERARIRPRINNPGKRARPRVSARPRSRALNGYRWSRG